MNPLKSKGIWSKTASFISVLRVWLRKVAAWRICPELSEMRVETASKVCIKILSPDWEYLLSRLYMLPIAVSLTLSELSLKYLRIVRANLEKCLLMYLYSSNSKAIDSKLCIKRQRWISLLKWTLVLFKNYDTSCVISSSMSVFWPVYSVPSSSSN